MTTLAIAIEERQWPLVSHYLLLGVSAAAAKLPAESLVALLDLLGGADSDVKGRARDR